MNPKELPEDHPLRNTPLGKLNAKYKIGERFRPVLPSFGIAGSTWNQLGKVWTQHDWELDDGSRNS